MTSAMLPRTFLVAGYWWRERQGRGVYVVKKCLVF